MDRLYYYSIMKGSGDTDYESYLNLQDLLGCQKSFDDLCTPDELQFQVVHQSIELLLKSAGFALLDIDDCLRGRQTNRVLTLFRRVHMTLQVIIDHLALLGTMSPKEYQLIRPHLGQGSGEDSPGFRAVHAMCEPLWRSFFERYVDEQGLSIEQIYNSSYRHCDAYAVAEAFSDFDELVQRFRFQHMQLVHRTIGMDARSLKGRSVEMLNEGIRTKLFPALWEVRSRMRNE